jgi:hypothetical protein
MQGQEEHVRASVRKGDEVIVRLTRRAGEKHASWGLQFDGRTMLLTKCMEKSIAVRSAEMCACIGLTLLKVDNIPINTPDCIRRVTARCASATFHFLPEDIKPMRHLEVDEPIYIQYSYTCDSATRWMIKSSCR